MYDVGMVNNPSVNHNMMPLSSTVSTTNSQRIGKRYKSFRKRNLSIFDKRNTNQDELYIRPQRKKPTHNTCWLCDMT